MEQGMAFSRSNLPTLLKAYLFLGSFVLVAVAFAYSYSWVSKVNRESQAVSQLIARFIAASALEAAENPRLKELFDEVVKPSDLPLILTDEFGRPYVWANIGVDPHAVDLRTISHWKPGKPAPPALRRILAKVEEFKNLHEPIPIYAQGSRRPFGYVYYGERKLARELRYIPLVQVLVIFLFVMLGYVGYRSMKTSEQRSIWIGLAKETAHQLGSPISSLMGWVELLRERVSDAEEKAEKERRDPASASIPVSELAEVLDEMEDDTERLRKVAKRFGQVGAIPKIEMTDLAPIVSSAVRYFRRRLPHLKKEIEIEEIYDVVPPVSVNEELIEWVVENLLKNAIDATVSGGKIRVEILHRRETECVELRITDQGKGMTQAEAKQIFSPGFTTKARGWGLGLTLAKRIVEDYHGGRIEVESTAPGVGTTLVVSFPV